MFDVETKLPEVEKILSNHGLQDKGPAQAFFSNELMKLSDAYVPSDSAGILSASARLSEDKESILYNTPYARYHWYGKLMVDPKTKKGAFFKEGYGFWSRPGVKKELTDRDMKYQGAPIRGPHWVERCWIDNKESLISSTQKYIERFSK